MLSEVSSWVMSIAGVICLSVIIELVIPDGQMNKYVKGIFGFITLFVIILPIPKIMNREIDLSNVFDYESSVKIDQEYIYQLNLDKMNMLKGKIESEILKYGYKNVSVYLNCNIFDNVMQIKSVSVDLSKLSISENAEHNDISKIRKHITAIIKSYIEIDEEEVRFSE